MQLEGTMLGIVEYRILDKDRKVIYSESGCNRIVNSGRGLILRLLNGVNISSEGAQVVGQSSTYPISKIGFGTNTTPPTNEDTSLSSDALIKYLDVGSARVIGNTEIIFDWSLQQSEGNGLVISELGLFSHDGTLFSRKVTNNPIIKDTDMSVEGSWRIVFLEPTVYEETVWGFAQGTDPAFKEEASNEFKKILKQLRIKYNIDK